ncbi:ABC-type nitrate/sulfonate/bicarbonate transport system substrate-binding protein [Dietzia sp. 2505]|uniref:ABC transporter substrate-binding protein n=1 Tax=Dietzia sp. 2505 TaxID=3156457 RepID=UPI0033993CB5
MTIDTLWYTRCPVPTASGIAHGLGTLAHVASSAGLDFRILQDTDPATALHHFDHQLPGLIREGGNVPALAARAAGAPTRLIGLTWVDEAQQILVAPASDITSAADLAGRRIAIPAWAADGARSFPRAMALHGFSATLALAGLTLAEVVVVEVDVERAPEVRDSADHDRSDPGRSITTAGVAELLAGEVDAIYVKGARGRDTAREHGLRIAVDLDTTTTPYGRVNNGTPRPITVHEQLLADHPEVVEDFLVRSLDAAAWAATDLEGVRGLLARETFAEGPGVMDAYGETFHAGLAPTLDAERLDLLAVQEQFLYTHGFLAGRVDVAAWADPAPLERAVATATARRTAHTAGVGA